MKNQKHNNKGMKAFQEYTKAKETEDPTNAYRPLIPRRPRLNEQLIDAATDCMAEFMPPAQTVVISEAQTLEYLFRLVVRLDREVARDASATENHKRLSMQNVALAFLVLRLVAAEIPSTGDSR